MFINQYTVILLPVVSHLMCTTVLTFRSICMYQQLTKQIFLLSHSIFHYVINPNKVSVICFW